MGEGTAITRPCGLRRSGVDDGGGVFEKLKTPHVVSYWVSVGAGGFLDLMAESGQTFVLNFSFIYGNKNYHQTRKITRRCRSI